MKRYRGFYALTLLVLLAGCRQSDPQTEFSRKELTIKYALEEDFRRTLDPALGYPPKERLIKAYEQIEAMRREMAAGRSVGVDNAKFVQRGPNNVGGRTRSILIDIRDPERKTIFVGSVGGGIWKTTNVTDDNPRWVAVNDYLANLAISCLAQDATNPDVMYAGTGEGFPNIDAIRGLGIFKSVDGGDTWSLLPSTDGNSAFVFTRAILVHPVTGDVYAATRDRGVQRSQDGGNTWTKVLGTSLSANDDNMFDLQFSGGFLFASNTSNVYSSQTGDRGGWDILTLPASGFPSSWSRCEFSVCDSDITTIFAVGSENGGGSEIYRTQNGGQTWISMGRPTGGDFTNGQAWYDLEIAVDPFSCTHVIVGGVGIYRTTNGGGNWQRFAQSMHVDQHRTVFDPEQQGVVYFSNDGGFYRSDGGSSVDPDNKNFGYVTTQYYGCALHPAEFSNYMLGGTQDNGTHRLSGAGTTDGDNIWGGDGFYCHIDQEDPNIQMVSSQFGNWGLSTNGGVTFSGGQQTNSGFVTPSDYDSRSKHLYTQTSDADFYRWNVITNVLDPVDISNAGGGMTAIHVDPNVENRVYFGNGAARVVRVDSANVGTSVVSTPVFMLPGGQRTISGIDVLLGDPDRILVSLSNYGIDNIHLSTDGGENWVVCDGNLPDMPVRSILFNPRNGNQAMIATEAGVWTTTFLDGPNTVWIPPVEGRGSPIVRVDDLEIRFSDYVVLAGTHGRGLWTTSVFSDPKPKIFATLINYVNTPVQFFGDASLNADTYSWDFGDGVGSDQENPEHVYENIGDYTVELTINGELSTSEPMKILPDGELPYVKEQPFYGGDFEGHTEQYGAYTVSGSAFERGKSSISGKNGTKSGDFAWVVGLNEPTYKPNSESYLYLPVYDFSEPSIYTFSFWARYLLHPGPDGFNVEYSTDRGRSWQILGSNNDKKWYNFNNSGVNTTAFPDGTPYFTGDVGGYTNFTHDLTFLTGQKDVAFRFVFRSESTGNHVGLAIDDVEVISYQGKLETDVKVFTAEFGLNKAIDVEWRTQPEYYCKKFEIERSVNGRDFEKIDEVQAIAGLSANATQYSKTTSGGRDFYFYRMKVINENVNLGYYLEFYTDTVTVRRNGDEPVSIYSIFPNPFIDNINITFNDIVDQTVIFKIYDASGRLIGEKEEFVVTPFYSYELGQWPPGVYYLNVQIGDEEAKAYRLLRVNN